MNRNASRIAACSAAALFAAALFAGLPLGKAAAYAAETEETVTLKDANGKNVQAVVYRNSRTGLWELASPIRNIYAIDLTGRFYDPTDPASDPVTGTSSTDFPDGVIVSAYVNTVTAYDFYTQANIGEDFFGVNGNNDRIAGTSGREEYTIYVYTHDVGESAAAFALFPGAFVAGHVNEGHMRVGDGSPDGSMYLPSRALDVIAHEYHHGVTTHFLTGDTYGGETGALKEAFSDVFGSLVEGHALDEKAFWTIGEDGMPAGKQFLRDLSDPQAPYVADMAHKYTGSEDRNGEHYNSTIISHLNYRLYTRIPDVLTRPVIGRLWFATLKNLAGKSEATFADFTDAFRRAAAGLPEEEGVLTAAGKAKLAEAVDDALFAAGLYEPDDVCTVTFEDGDGHVLKTERVRAGGSATPPAPPEKAPDAEGHYVFSAWDGVYTAVQQNETVRATFTQQSHTFGAWQETPPTCEDAGERRAECTDCGYETSEEISAKGHTFGGWTQTVPPTYTEAGTATRTCSECGETETKEIPALGLKQKFLDLMAALGEASGREEIFGALKAANETYQLLTEAEKSEVAAEYGELVEAVHAYNAGAEAHNGAFENAYTGGIGACSAVLAAAAALALIVRRFGR